MNWCTLLRHSVWCCHTSSRICRHWNPSAVSKPHSCSSRICRHWNASAVSQVSQPRSCSSRICRHWNASAVSKHRSCSSRICRHWNASAVSKPRSCSSIHYTSRALVGEASSQIARTQFRQQIWLPFLTRLFCSCHVNCPQEASCNCPIFCNMIVTDVILLYISDVWLFFWCIVKMMILNA
jgi:hypothetical protein